MSPLTAPPLGMHVPRYTSCQCSRVTTKNVGYGMFCHSWSILLQYSALQSTKAETMYGKDDIYQGFCMCVRACTRVGYMCDCMCVSVCVFACLCVLSYVSSYGDSICDVFLYRAVCSGQTRPAVRCVAPIGTLAAPPSCVSARGRPPGGWLSYTQSCSPKVCVCVCYWTHDRRGEVRRG